MDSLLRLPIVAGSPWSSVLEPPRLRTARAAPPAQPLDPLAEIGPVDELDGREPLERAAATLEKRLRVCPPPSRAERLRVHVLSSAVYARLGRWRDASIATACALELARHADDDDRARDGAPAPPRRAVSETHLRAVPDAPTRLHIDAASLTVTFGALTLDLRRRPVLWALLACLAREHAARRGERVSAEKLIASVWPDQRLVGRSGRDRLKVVVQAGRSLGLRAVVLSGRPDGYLLDPNVEVRFGPGPAPASAASAG